MQSYPLNCLSLNQLLHKLIGFAHFSTFNEKRSRRSSFTFMENGTRGNFAKTYLDYVLVCGVLVLSQFFTAFVNLNRLRASLTTLVCWIFRPRQISSVSLKSFHSRSILAPHANSKTSIGRSATSINYFVISAFYSHFVNGQIDGYRLNFRFKAFSSRVTNDTFF